jgi:hypothetical protein
VTVRFADAEPNGLADLVGRLIEANLERRPDSRNLLRPAVVELSASDADVRATVALSGGAVEISNGSADREPHLRVVARSEDLLELSTTPLRFGLPDAFDARGRAVLRGIATRRVRVSGMVRHPMRLSRFTRLLSVVE